MDNQIIFYVFKTYVDFKSVNDYSIFENIDLYYRQNTMITAKHSLLKAESSNS